jgi:nitroreductase
LNDFLELCGRRQSCRDFNGQPVEHEKLVKCAEAGRLTQSACNGQPWSFVIVESPEVVAEVAKCGQQMGINGFLDKAGAFIIVLEEHAVLMPALRRVLDSQYFAKGDLGAAAAHICLEAESLGLASCNIGLYDREKLCELLHIPIEKQFAAYIALGYATDAAVRPKIRKSFDQVTRFV